jgi:hypothetical protein
MDRYDVRRVKKCLNKSVSCSWAQGKDPYEFPSVANPELSNACLYEACDLNWEVDYLLITEWNQESCFFMSSGRAFPKGKRHGSRARICSIVQKLFYNIATHTLVIITKKYLLQLLNFDCYRNQIFRSVYVRYHLVSPSCR